MQKVRLLVSGKVQGVGFRYSTYALALDVYKRQSLTLILKMLQSSWNKAIISLPNIHWKFMLAPLLPF